MLGPLGPKRPIGPKEPIGLKGYAACYAIEGGTPLRPEVSVGPKELEDLYNGSAYRKGLSDCFS
jgi:hypothetical protein